MTKKRSSRMMTQSAICTAFTLIELLVVIAIIAILISIVIPSLKRAKFSAQKVICSNNLRQQSLGIQLYANENDSTVMESAFGGWLWDQSFLTTDQMAEAAGFDSKTFFCPSRPDAQYDDARRWQYRWLREEGVVYPSKVSVRNESQLSREDRVRYFRELPYIYMIEKRNPATGESLMPSKLVTGEPAKWIHKINQMQSTGTTIMAMDAVISQGDNNKFFDIDAGGIVELSGGTLFDHTNHRISGRSKPEGANIVYVDGHVGWRQFGPYPPNSDMKHRLTTEPVWYWW